MFQLSLVFLVLMLVSSFPARAELVVEGVAKNCNNGFEEPCYHVFAGDKLHIIYRPINQELELPCKGMWGAGLRQVTTRLNAKVPDAVTPEQGDACISGEFDVQIPVDVKSETKFSLVVVEPPRTDIMRIQGLGIKVYPCTLLDDVKSWADYKDNALVVRDKEGRLTEMLDRQKVNYVTREPVPASARKLTIVTGKDAEAVDGDAIYLRENVETFPAVRIVQTQQGKTVTVEMKLVDALAADEPLAQKMFVEIFKEIAK